MAKAATAVTQSGIAPTWSTFAGINTAGTSYTQPNIIWQGTTSGSTYTSASTALQS